MGWTWCAGQRCEKWKEKAVKYYRTELRPSTLKARDSPCPIILNTSGGLWMHLRLEKTLWLVHCVSVPWGFTTQRAFEAQTARKRQIAQIHHMVKVAWILTVVRNVMSSFA